MANSKTDYQEFPLSPTPSDVELLNTAIASCDMLSEYIADEANRRKCFTAETLLKDKELKQSDTHWKCREIAGPYSVDAAYRSGTYLARHNRARPAILRHRGRIGSPVVVKSNGMYCTKAFADVPSIPIKGYHIPNDMVDIAVQISVRNDNKFYAKFSRQAKPNAQTSIPLDENEGEPPSLADPDIASLTTEVTLVDALRAAEKSIEAAQLAHESAKHLVSSLIPHVELLVNKIQSFESSSKADTDEVLPINGWPGKDTHVVYFVQGTESLRIKIGETQNLPERMRRLRGGQTPEQLRILGWMPGNKKTEKELHSKFLKHRVHNEWFTPAVEIYQYIVEHTHRVYEE